MRMGALAQNPRHLGAASGNVLQGGPVGISPGPRMNIGAPPPPPPPYPGPPPPYPGSTNNNQV